MHAETLGTKRVCPSCQTKFYDFGKDPVECPKCHWTATLIELARHANKSRKKNDPEKDIEVTSAETRNESLIEYEIEESELGEDLLIGGNGSGDEEADED